MVCLWWIHGFLSLGVISFTGNYIVLKFKPHISKCWAKKKIKQQHKSHSSLEAMQVTCTSPGRRKHAMKHTCDTQRGGEGCCMELQEPPCAKMDPRCWLIALANPYQPSSADAGTGWNGENREEAFRAGGGSVGGILSGRWSQGQHLCQIQALHCRATLVCSWVGREPPQ